MVTIIALFEHQRIVNYPDLHDKNEFEAPSAFWQNGVRSPEADDATQARTVNSFNRLVVVILLLVAIPACTVTLAIPAQAVQFAQGTASVVATWLGGPGSTILEAAERITLGGRVLLAILAVALDVGLGILLVHELRRTKVGAVVQARGSVAVVSPESIQAQVRHAVSALEGLLDVNVSVRPKSSGRVEVTLDVLAEPEMRVAPKVTEIARVVREVTRENLGLRLAGGPIIHLELASPSAVAGAEEVLGRPAVLASPPSPASETVPAPSEPEMPAPPLIPVAASPAEDTPTDDETHDHEDPLGPGQASGQDLGTDGERAIIDE
jgi:hypothetical protein